MKLIGVEIGEAKGISKRNCNRQVRRSILSCFAGRFGTSVCMPGMRFAQGVEVVILRGRFSKV